MRQRQAVWVIGFVVLGMVAFGGWSWTNRRDVERTVNVFLTAMVQGDAETLWEHMSGPLLNSYLAKSPADQDTFAKPIPGATFEIREVHLQGSSANVRVLWKVSGFDVWSDLELTKAAMQPWKITNIRQPKMIPTWEQVRQKIEEEHPPTSSQEVLAEKLDGREGVEVRPLDRHSLDH